MFGVYVILSLGLDVALGWTGLVHLAPAAFYGVGAYVSALWVLRVMPDVWYGYWISLPVVLIFNAALGYLLALPALRLRGLYFAIATLGFGELVRSVLVNWVSLTGGPYGLKGIPRPYIGSLAITSTSHFFYLIFAFVLGVGIVLFRLSRGPSGRAWMGIREDEIAATTLGIDVNRGKAEALAVSAAISGLAGWLFAPYVSYLSPSNFTLDESIIILCMVIIGGRGTIWGPVVGATLLVLAPELLRGLAQYRLLIYGVLLCATMVVRPRGLLGRLRR
jgi:branched-chain amino acid transport system permease protein